MSVEKMAVRDSMGQAVAAREAIFAKKGIDPLILDVRRLSGVTDFYVLASGNSGPHLKALEAEVRRGMTGAGMPRPRSAGAPESGWIVVDYLDVVVHLFTPRARAYYAMEELWSDAPRVD